jgi:uncharacterized protein
MQPSSPITTPPKPAEIPPPPPPPPPVSTPDPAPQHMAVAPEPMNEGIALPTVEVESSTHNDHPDHTPEPLTEADAKPVLKMQKPSIPPPMPSSGSQAPIGAIVATIIGMIILCGLAIAVYMTSHSSL